MKYLTEQQQEAQLRLFKSYLNKDALIIGSKVLTIEDDLKQGIVYYGIEVPESIRKLSLDMFGKKPEEWNSTFHKSFKTVLETPIEVLIAQQVIHYFTTYGLESLDLYNGSLVYIPNEKLEIPELEEDIPLVVIKEVTEVELTEKLMKLLTSGIALSKQTIKDVMLLSDFIDKEKVDDINNREVKTAMYEKYNLVPSYNMEFFRYLIFKTTGDTLLIKSNDLYKKIKKADIDSIYNYLNNYVNKPNGYEKLAEIYLRFKKLFLAYKREKGSCLYAESINHIINRLDKFARIKGYHKSIGKGILDNLTNMKNPAIVSIATPDIYEALDQATIFREISIVNSLKYRIDGNESILYKIRNGKAFANTIKNKKDNTEAQIKVLEIVYNHLKKRVNKLLTGKKVYLPEHIDITAPTSEKQYIGYLPYGTSIKISRLNDMIVGVHWKNFENERIDLDIHTMNMNQSFGWNTGYRSETGDIAFSGDVTDAILPKGATELFAISKDCNDTSFLLTINDYTRNSKDIPFELILASEKNIKLETNYIINPNKVIISVPCLFEVNNGDNFKTTLGLIKINKDNLEFYFNKYDMGSSIITSRTNVNKITYDYLDNYSNTQLTLRQLLEDSLIEICNEPYTEKLEEVKVTNEEGIEETLYKKVKEKVDYDLSLNSIDKTTIINMLTEEK